MRSKRPASTVGGETTAAGKFSMAFGVQNNLRPVIANSSKQRENAGQEACVIVAEGVERGGTHSEGVEVQIACGPGSAGESRNKQNSSAGPDKLFKAHLWIPCVTRESACHWGDAGRQATGCIVRLSLLQEKEHGVRSALHFSRGGWRWAVEEPGETRDWVERVGRVRNGE